MRPCLRAALCSALLPLLLQAGPAPKLKSGKRPEAPVAAPLFRKPIPDMPQEGADLGQRRREAWRWYHGGSPSPEDAARIGDHAALEELRRARQPRAEAAPSLSWRQLGPLDMNSYGSDAAAHRGAGRIRSIVPHPTRPQTLFICSPGGVFRCDNADPAHTPAWTWRRITESIPTAQGFLAADPANPERMCYTLADGVGGIYITEDGGASWRAAVGAGTWGKSVRILSDGTTLVGTGNGVLRAPSQAGPYTQINLPGLNGWAIDSLAALDGGIVLAVGNGLLYRSTDRGATWSTVSLPPAGGSLSAGYRVWRVAGSGTSAYATWGGKGLLTTSDSGATWSYPEPTLGVGNDTGMKMGTLVAMDPRDPQKVFAGEFHLYRSMDGGHSFDQMGHWVADRLPFIHADQHSTAFHPSDPNLVFFGHDGGLSVARNPYAPIQTSSSGAGPNQWDDLPNTGRGDLMLYRIGSTQAATPAHARAMLAVGTQDHGTGRREGDPATLDASVRATVGWTGDGMGTLIHPANGNQWLIAGYCGYLLRSSNAGQSFSGASSGITETGCSYNEFFTVLAQGAEADTAYTLRERRLYRTTNYGQSWSPVPTAGLGNPNGFRTVAAAPSDGQTLALALDYSNGQPAGYTTTNLGATWQPWGVLTGAGWPNVSSLAFDPQQSRTLLVGSSSWGTSYNHLWRSTDGGATWTALDNSSNGFPFGIPVNVVRIHPQRSGTLYAGTHLGVYASTDTGASWTRLGDGFPYTITTDLWVAPDGMTLRAATYGMGAWELQAQAPVISAFTATPAVFVAGGSVTLAWTVSGASSLALDQGVGQVTGLSSKTVTPPAGADLTYTLTASNITGSATATALVRYRSRDLLADGTTDLLDLALLARAFGSQVGQDHYLAAADFNGDGRVDQADLDLFLAGL